MAMEVDETIRPTSSRKRRLTRSHDEDEEDDLPDWSHYDATTASSKRSRASAGHAVERRRVRIDTQTLIRSFAFASLNVTFNYNHYNPSTSSLIVLLLSDGSSYTTYLSYCDMALRLTIHGPDLQALALRPETAPDSWMSNKLLTQTLPIHVISEVQDEMIDDLQGFLAAYAGPADALTLLDAHGTCIWDSGELSHRHNGGSTDLLHHDIEAALASQLRSSRAADQINIA